MIVTVPRPQCFQTVWQGLFGAHCILAAAMLGLPTLSAAEYARKGAIAVSPASGSPRTDFTDPGKRYIELQDRDELLRVYEGFDAQRGRADTAVPSWRNNGEIDTQSDDTIHGIISSAAIRSPSDPTTGIFFPQPGEIVIVVGGIPIFTFYRANGDGRFEQYSFGSGGVAKSNPFGIGATLDVARPKWRAGTGLSIYEGGDPGEITFYNKANEFDHPANIAKIGSEATKFGQQGFMTWKLFLSDELDGSSASLVGVYKAIRPVVITGSPAFTGSRWFRTSAVSGPVDGERVHLYSAFASGSNPTLSLSGETARKILRGSGAAPANNYWTAGWEGTFTYSTAADGGAGGWLADVDSGTDFGGGGRTVDLRNTTPFYFRSAMLSNHYVSKPTSVSTAGMLTFAATPDFEISPRIRAWLGPTGGVVFGGRMVHEDYVDTEGYNGKDRYPGVITLDRNDASTDPWVNSADKTSVWGTGGVNTPKTRPPWANASFIASDFSKWPFLGMRGGLDVRYGVDFGYDASNRRLTIETLKAGATPNTITALADNGLGQFRVTSTAHGLRDGDWVRGAGTDNGSLDNDYLVSKVDDDRFDLVNTRYASVNATGTFTKSDPARPPRP